jgi:hypothetical protein
VADVLTEELGHYIDSKLNLIDTPGDEGEHFAALVGGEVLSWEDVGRLRGEDDRVRILGGLVEVEASGEVSFSKVGEHEMGVSPGLATVGDFNGDGIPDLVVRDSRANDFTVLLGLGDGNFSTKTNNIGKPTLSMTSGDFSGDGISDLAVITSESVYGPLSPKVSILLGRGDGSLYTLTSSLSTEEEPTSVVVGEFNEDDFPDLAVVNKSDSISIFLSRSSVSFDSAINYEVGNAPKSIAVGEFNGDGISDLAVANAESDNISILLGLEDGNFGTAANFEVGESPVSVAVGEFNGDSISDLAVANMSSNSASVLFGEGDGNFNKSTNFAVGETPTSVAVGEFNGDGISDLAVKNSASDSVSILLGAGDGSFDIATEVDMGRWFSTSLLGDFNGDGLSDLAASENGFYYSSSGPYSYHSVSVLLNTTPATIAPPKISTTNAKTVEGNTGTNTANFTVSLSAPASQTVTVNYTTANGSAKAGQDYQTTKGTLTFSPGEITKTIIVPIVGDTESESAEKFKLKLSNPTNATLKDKQGIATITNDDGTQSKISIGDVKMLEGNRGRKNAQYQVTLDTKTNQTVTVNYTTANQTAKANQDYKPTQGILTFQPGETKKTITVPILGDTQIEPNETFQLKLSNPTGAELKDKLGIGTIINDDTPQLKIDLGDTKIVEGNRGRKNAKFQITLDAKPEETVRVNYTTANQTAKANQDYKPTRGTLTFKPGQTRKTITVPILGDTQIEPNETFQLNLSKPRNAQLKDRRGIGTIINDDFAQLSIKDTQITEGDSGKKQAKFTVALNQKINQRVRVNYATSDITAKEGSDYQKTNGKLTFKPGQTRQTITVPILGDTLDEDNEKFSVTLRKPSKGVKLGDKRAIGTIKDNDAGGDKPGDSFQAAINIGKLTEEWVTVDEIGFTEKAIRDTNDFYRFQTDKEGTFVLTLDDLLKDANVDLYGSGEELINQSKNDGTQRETIVTVLDPGTYYVRVYPQGSDRSPYRLSLDLL